MAKKTLPFADLFRTDIKTYRKLAMKRFKENHPEKFILKDEWRRLDKNIFAELPDDVIPVDGFPTYYARPNGEVWRDTRGLPSAVKTGKERVLKLTPTFNAHNGYWIIQPYKDKKKKAIHLHRFILTAFKGVAPDPTMECHHIDHNTSNNAIDNLMWVTRLENAQYVPRHHRAKPKIKLGEGRKTSTSKHSHLYPTILELYKAGITVTKIAKILNIKTGTIEQVIKKFTMDGTISRIKRKHINQVNQYDLKGNFIKTWDNAKDAAEHITGRRAASSMITENCNGGRSKTAYGFIWRWV